MSFRATEEQMFVIMNELNREGYVVTVLNSDHIKGIDIRVKSVDSEPIIEIR